MSTRVLTNPSNEYGSANGQGRYGWIRQDEFNNADNWGQSSMMNKGIGEL